MSHPPRHSFGRPPGCAELTHFLSTYSGELFVLFFIASSIFVFMLGFKRGRDKAIYRILAARWKMPLNDDEDSPDQP